MTVNKELISVRLQEHFRFIFFSDKTDENAEHFYWFIRRHFVLFTVLAEL